MRREDDVRLRHMVEAARAAIRYLGRSSAEEIAADDMRARAIDLPTLVSGIEAILLGETPTQEGLS